MHNFQVLQKFSKLSVILVFPKHSLIRWQRALIQMKKVRKATYLRLHETLSYLISKNTRQALIGLIRILKNIHSSRSFMNDSVIQLSRMTLKINFSEHASLASGRIRQELIHSIYITDVWELNVRKSSTRVKPHFNRTDWWLLKLLLLIFY